VAVLSTNGTEPAPVDLSSGSSQARVDVFAADPAASFQLSIRAILPAADPPSGLPIGAGLDVPLLTGAADFQTVHDGDSLPVMLELKVPMTFVSAPSSALGPTPLVNVDLCDLPDAASAPGANPCTTTVDPIVGLPSFSSGDGGDAEPEETIDATADGTVIETADAVAPATAGAGGD
jgi:hypothetical protein